MTGDGPDRAIAAAGDDGVHLGAHGLAGGGIHLVALDEADVRLDSGIPEHLLERRGVKADAADRATLGIDDRDDPHGQLTSGSSSRRTSWTRRRSAGPAPSNAMPTHSPRRQRT